MILVHPLFLSMILNSLKIQKMKTSSLILRFGILGLALFCGGQAFAQYNPRLYTPQRLAQKGLSLPAAKQERFSLGTGQAQANYYEESYPLNEDFNGISWEYWEQLYHGNDGGGGWSTSWSLLDSRFEIRKDDEIGHNHHAKTHLLAGLWAFGLDRQQKLGRKYMTMFGANLYLGIGLVQFSKQLTYIDGREYNFDPKYGFDLVTGWDGHILLEYDESWFLGWKRSFYRNKIKIEYSEEVAFLTHIESTLFFVGRRFGQVSCVSTAYVICD